MQHPLQDLLLTTEAAICEIPEEKKEAAGHAHGGMGGMGGMARHVLIVHRMIRAHSLRNK